MKNLFYLLMPALLLASCKDENPHFEDCCKINNQWILNDSTKVAIPNAFTPNGDALNDFLSAYGAGITSFTFSVKDNGRVIFQTNSLNLISSGWNGKDGSEQSPPGIYDIEATWQVPGNSTPYIMTGSACLFRDCFPEDLPICIFADMITNGVVDTNNVSFDSLPECN